ncbi:MAG: hypothetical protein A2W90_09330 [Bacteroidetes bacterium GWF2_42_66]|nr:MAG: hypothetical protein A2W92_00020 [Bacteroidetes bacterium GWA2_42_15]OFY01713.1 MAG: hypothetical protein A2W89_22535 [Bacteroidetes bacterium GWE2_42_39]OFY46460.1 MAG: hypothetical protein A2W90_09330 [Bacteroidetes bacterium GWF2_42_66]HAZ02959.1 hypothetical protein [Marinilabiliales bacterium]HBL76138.1 hypothetical protein [Prolixibacteraceae bacterium]
MKEKVDPALIRNYTKGQYSFRDLKRIVQWFQDFRYHSDIKSVIDSHWEEFGLNENHAEKDLSAVFNKLKEKILAEKNTIGFRQRFISVYARIAAVLLLPLLIYSAFSLLNQTFNLSDTSSWVEIVSPAGMRTHFDLPDGTKVSLNGDARLKYKANFQKDRQLVLEGEAYFNVHHDASSPFVVQTEVMDVKVLGTKFSVVSMAEENSVEVVLEEGKVQLLGKDNSFVETLNPNEGFFYNKENRSGKITTVDASYLTSWKDGLLVFRNEPLGEVMNRVGRWYNVKFDIVDAEVQSFRYRATFGGEPLEEVLRLISLTAPVEYEIKERKINKDGKFENKIIEVRLKKQL